MAIRNILGQIGAEGPVENPSLLGRAANVMHGLSNNPAWQRVMSRERGEDPYAFQQAQAQQELLGQRRQQFAMQQQEQEAAKQAEAQRQQQLQMFMQTPEFANLDPLSKQYIQATGDLSVVKSRLGAGPEAPSNVREWEYYSAMSPEQQRQYLEMKRAAQMMDLGDRFAVRDPITNQSADIPGARVELAPSETPEHRGAVAEAEAAASAGVNLDKQGAERFRANQAAMSVYETAMQGLMSGLSGVDTGPVIGRLPAWTPNQQIAEGAIAAMAPVLKTIFREAGEGAFTEGDQKLLLDMLPTRKDEPEAIAQKMANIDAIVRAKLGEATAPAGISAPTPSVRRRYNPQTREFE